MSWLLCEPIFIRPTTFTSCFVTSSYFIQTSFNLLPRSMMLSYFIKMLHYLMLPSGPIILWPNISLFRCQPPWCFTSRTSSPLLNVNKTLLSMRSWPSCGPSCCGWRMTTSPASMCRRSTSNRSATSYVSFLFAVNIPSRNWHLQMSNLCSLPGPPFIFHLASIPIGSHLLSHFSTEPLVKDAIIIF